MTDFTREDMRERLRSLVWSYTGLPRQVADEAADAIDFACDHASEPLFFLEDWRMGRANEWPEYMRWLKAQRDGARAAQEASNAKD